MLTELQYVDYVSSRSGNTPHPLCAFLRQLRQAAGLSLAQFEARYGISAVVVGAYERGDRVPPVPKLERIFACYGYELMPVPTGTNVVRRPDDLVVELRAIADQLETAARMRQEQEEQAGTDPQLLPLAS